MRWLLLLLLMNEAAASLETAMEKTQRQVHDVYEQLSAATQIASLFMQEKQQRELYALETAAKMQAERDAVMNEIEATKKEVEQMLQAVVDNATHWKKTVDQLRAANEQSLRGLRQRELRLEELKAQELEKRQEKERLAALKKREEEQRALQKQQQEAEERAVLLRQREKEQEALLRQQKERAGLQRQQEEQEQTVLLKQRAEEREAHRKQQEEDELAKLQEQREEEALLKQQESKQQKHRQAIDSNTAMEQRRKVSSSIEAESNVALWKHFVDWYLSAEQVVFDAGAAVSRKLVIPVIAILMGFLVATVGVARYNAVQRARRSPRVLYSGYPNSYRRKPKAADAGGLQSRRAVPRRVKVDF